MVTDAATKTSVSNRLAFPWLRSASTAPSQRNTPSASTRWAMTSTAARKPMVGASAITLCSASAGEIRPRAKAMPAAGTAATTSGRFLGRAMANASTANSSATPITVASSGVITMPRGRSRSRTLLERP